MAVAPFSTETTTTETTDYVGNVIYKDNVLNRILVDGGYIEKGVYHYYMTDHLSNNRVVVNASGTVTQRNHYYPFGTAFAEKYDNGKKQPYKYNVKELDQMHGLNLYDYSARYYESAIGRFTSVDPHAENYYSWSPYAYCANNPMNRFDPDGKDHYYSQDGVYLGLDDKKTQYVWAVANDSYTQSKGSTVILESGLTQIMDNQGNGMLHDQFIDLAGTLYAEGASTWEEAAAIYSVMENRGNAEDMTTLDIAKGGGIYGYKERDKINSKFANKNQTENAYKGLIRGALDSKDYSGGGYYWHGKDFGKSTWRANKDYYQVGFEFTDSKHDLWGQGNHVSGNKKWDYKYESTGASGSTTFMKLTDTWMKSTGAKRWNGKTR